MISKKYLIVSLVLIIGVLIGFNYSSAHFSKPTFRDKNGKTIESVICGDKEQAYSLDVSNHSNTKIWLLQTKNGKLQYEGELAVPSPLYTAVCNQDEGEYSTSVYHLDNGKKGAFIGSIKFYIEKPPFTCSLSVETNQSNNVIYVGENARFSWTINNVINPNVFKSYWYGTKNGVNDVSGAWTIFSGNVLKWTTDIYKESQVGEYTRKIQFRDSFNKNVCETNSVSVSVRLKPS
ncbi:MAG: hypothetical protein COV30_01140, partial [Candidatus Yanofskybacteria bacterium CG10_big_fil_rev_8_21_14_0_10_37_15]